MELAYYCMDNPSHIFSGGNLDGVRCPYCDGLVNVKPVSNEEYEKLPKYRELKKQRRKSKGLSINIDFDDKTILKLRAIAKHTDALADELDAIDSAWTCDCGSIDYKESKLCETGTGNVLLHERICDDCNKTHSMIDEELPTRLEGSE